MDYISKNIVECIIADKKYKPINNIGNQVYLQVPVYMFRFNVKKGFFYLDSKNTKDLKLEINRGSIYENDVEPRSDFCITIHGLKIPYNVENYHDFCA